MTTAMHDIGYVMTDRDPDYVVLGETRTYSFEAITRAIRLIDAGARFIATNPDASGPSAAGKLPGVRLGRRPDQYGDRPAAVLRRQAQPADDAQRAEPARGALRDHRDDRRPDGHRHHQRARGRASAPCWSRPARPRPTRSTRSPTGRPGSSTRSRTSSSWPASRRARCDRRGQLGSSVTLSPAAPTGDVREVRARPTQASARLALPLPWRSDGITTRHELVPVGRSTAPPRGLVLAAGSVPASM